MGGMATSGLVAIVLCGGCSVEAVEDADADAEPGWSLARAETERLAETSPLPGDSNDDLPLLETYEAERTGEAELDISPELCAYICSGSAVLACVRMGQICKTAATITLGRSVLPCATVQLAVCANAAGLGTVCNMHCPR
jgi:hypothetical protein